MLYLNKPNKFLTNGAAINKIRKILNEKGLTLFEILVAFVLFSVFYVVFIGSQRDSQSDSTYMAEELILHNLCENVINDILFSPPPLNLALTLVAETSRFEDSNLSDFEYTVEYKQFELPNFFEIFQDQQGSEEEGAKNPQMQYLNILFKQIKENIKEALWQVRVTVTNKITGGKFSLSSWIRNPNFEIEANFGGVGGSGGGSSSGGSN